MKKICQECGKERYFTFSWEQRCITCQKKLDLKNIQDAIRNNEEDVDTGSSDYVICPYCGEEMETCYGYEDFPEIYEEGEHEIECPECERTFILESSCSWYYETKKKEGEADD